MKKLTKKEQKDLFETLSVEVQQEIKDWLSIYDDTSYETYSDGSTRVSSHTFIKGNYEKQIVSTVKFEKDAILTEQEIKQYDKELAQCNLY